MEVGNDGKKWAHCNHCKRKFDGSSSKGTTHLRNHLKSCLGLRNPSGVADKVKEKSVIDPKLNDSDLMRKIIKYGLKGIENDILDFYQQERDKLRGYLHKLPCRFNVTIQDEHLDMWMWSMKIWFIDDSWELKKIYICVGEYKNDVRESVKSSLVDWNIDKKMCSMIGIGDFDDDHEEDGEVVENICEWFNERGSLPSTGKCLPVYLLLQRIRFNFSFDELKRISRNDISTKLDKLFDYAGRNQNKFQDAVEKALSMGKTVTSKIIPSLWVANEDVLEWVMECKEAFCELENIDPHFKSINFIKEDWDELTLLYNGWKGVKELQDWGQDVNNKLFDPKYNTANVYFLLVCDLFFKLVQLGKSDNHYCRLTVSLFREYFDKYWNNSKLVLVIMAILDPRFKMDCRVENFYKEMYGNDASALDDVTNIFNQYAEGTNNSMSSSSQESELNRYLRDSKCLSDEKFCILEWWRLNSSTYPTLARMARDFLSISIFAFDIDAYDIYASWVEIEVFYDFDDFYELHVANLYDKDIIRKFGCTKTWLNYLENN